MSYQSLARIACLWICLPGCGPSNGDVSGVVKYQNKPLAGGTITFYDEHKQPTSSVIQEDGAYSVIGVKTGIAKVAVVMPVAIPMPGMPVVKALVIPSKYNDHDQSGLTCKITADKQKQDFNLD